MCRKGKRADAPRDADEIGPVHAKAGRGRFLCALPRQGAGDDIRWKVGTLGTSLQTNLVTSAEFWKAFHETGAIYFIRNARADEIKVGHSRDPRKRLADLKVGSSFELELIGVIAAAREIEPIVHRQFYEGRIRGEWFYDRGITSQWLMDMTQGEPLHRHVWKLVETREILCTWDEATRTHIKHVWDTALSEWVPRLPSFKGGKSVKVEANPASSH
jgi:hypothetical protein